MGVLQYYEEETALVTSLALRAVDYMLTAVSVGVHLCIREMLNAQRNLDRFPPTSTRFLNSSEKNN